MFFTVGCVYLSMVQWFSEKRRHSMYRRFLPQALRNASIMVQRNPPTGSLVSSQSFLDSLNSLKTESVLFEDRDCIYYVLTPKMKINLETWTAYYAVKSMESLGQFEEEKTTVLLESHRPADVQQFLHDTFAVPQNKQVHVLNQGTALAWRPGPPFGIILQCSQENLVDLCMAFVDGALTMDEDLEVHRVISIETEGSAKPLVSKVADSCEEDLDRQETRTNHTSEWSNESLADSASVLNVDLQSITEQEDVESVEMENQEEDESFDIVNSGSGEALCYPQASPFTSRGKQLAAQLKPPNVLIYCGIKDAKRKFESLKLVLEECLNSDRYVIYHLKHEHVHTTPWAENTELLLISTDSLHDKCDDLFCGYFENGGKILSFGSSLDSMFVPRREVRRIQEVAEVNYDSVMTVPLLCGRYVYMPVKTPKENVSVAHLALDSQDQVVMLKLTQIDDAITRRGDTIAVPSGIAVLSQVLLDQDPTDVATTPEVFNQLKSSNAQRLDILRHLLEHLQVDCQRVWVPEFTPSLLMAREEKLKTVFYNSISSRLKDSVLKSTSVSLHFVTDPGSEVPTPTASVLPVLTMPRGTPVKYFDDTRYWENLKSKTLGNVLMYTDVLPTTMVLFDSLQFSLPNSIGLIAIAGRQTQGKGRGGNVWLSPPGCAMFSLHVRLDVESPLGKAASYLQHITSLAVVESVRSIPGYQEIDLRLKWPNDIYYGDKMKLGGVIVKSTILDGVCHAIIGCGFNVSNSNPTICIHDLIQRYNRDNGTNLAECSKEQLIARTVTIIEELISEFQREGSGKFCAAYYRRWLHSGSKVRLEREGNKEVVIEGLDQYGYLAVRTEGGTALSVQPDGNSFDMMRNLISMKTN